MDSAWPKPTAAWVMPIVLVICALMILPAGAVLSHSSQGTSTGAAVAYGAPSGGAAPNPASTYNAYSPLSVAAKIAAAHATGTNPYASASTSGISSSDYASALQQIASKPGFSYGGTLDALASQIASGKVSPSSAYLPNLQLLSEQATHPQAVGSGYTLAPAPIGLGDLGLGSAGPYSYDATHFAGSLTLDSANATYPGAYYFITPPGATNSSYNTPYEFGIQLNTVTTNFSIPGDSNASFWTQNVVALNGNILQFEDNIWNFSGEYLVPGTFYDHSYNGTPVYPAFYYDYGPVLQLTFPVTINLYNNVSVVNDRDQVTFGYRVVDSKGAFSGIYDTVVFNSPGAAVHMAPPQAPSYQVNGKWTTPIGLDYESELIFGGPGGGSNAVFNTLSGSMQLQYSNAASGGWTNIPSAYDFGSDTGETAVGVAAYWPAAGTEDFSAGPSLLYGLWGAVAHTAVPSGDIEFQGTLSPSYGFVFAGDTVANETFVPTTASGTFQTYLPPRTPQGSVYNVSAYADGYAADTTATFTGSITGYTITLTSAPGTFNAPLYMDGNAQALAAATAAGVVGPSSYNFSGEVSPALIFTHLNDWGYVSFNLFQATGVSHTINVTDMFQGPNVGPDTRYTMDGQALGSAATLLGIPPVTTLSLPDYGQLIAFYSSSPVQIYDEEMRGYFGGSVLTTGCPELLQTLPKPECYYALNPAGGAVVLWNSPGAKVNETLAEEGSYGVYIAGSPDPNVAHAYSILGATAVSFAGDSNPIANDVVAGFFGIGSYSWSNMEGAAIPELDFGVYDSQSTGGTYSNIDSYSGSFGVYADESTGTVIDNTYVEYASYNISNPYTGGGAAAADMPTSDLNGFGVGAVLIGTQRVTVENTEAVGEEFYNGVYEHEAYNNTVGVEAIDTLGTTVVNLIAEGYFAEAVGVALDGSDYTNVTNYDDVDSYLGGLFEFAGNSTFVNTTFYDPFIGAAGLYNYYTTFDWVNGTYIDEFGVGLADSDFTVVNHVSITDSYFAFYLESDTDSSVTNLDAAAYGEGVLFTGSGSGTASSIDSSFDSLGAEVSSGSGITITDATATNDSWAAELYDGAMGNTVTNVAATNASVGVEAYEADANLITGVSATNSSVGVFVEDSEFLTVRGVTATSTMLVSPWSEGPIGPTIAAVVTEDSTGLTISYVNATVYPAALLDLDSYGITATNLNATSSWYALILNETYNSVFSGVGAYKDYQGALLEDDAEDNDILGGSFVDDTSYGVAILYGYDNSIYQNDFIGNNGATSTYNAAHIQAWVGYGYNYFYLCTQFGDYYCQAGIGNYWADWHTYGSNGYLAPYLISGENWDYFPIGPQETFTVTFTETGLSSGTNWSVTFNGVTHSSTTSTITFESTIGTFSYTVNGVQGYQLNSGPTGSVTLTGTPVSIAVVYTSTAPLATQSTVNSFFSVALIIAIIALVLALLALLWRRGGEKKPEPTTGSPTPWTPPSGATTGPTSGEATGGAGAGPSSGSGATWSEGSSSGSGSPPPSS